MGAARAGWIAEQLMAGGLSADTPVAVVERATHDTQATQRATLAHLGELNLRSPCAIVIGTVAASDLSWFSARSVADGSGAAAI